MNEALSRITLRGGNALKGNIVISGAKNAALKLACAAILTNEPVTFSRMPNSLRDIRSLYDLLSHLGASIEEAEGRVTLTFAEIVSTTAPYDLVRKMRASIMVLGPLLAREGRAKVSLPGGCAIGTRPVDYHIEGLKALGAQIELKEGYIHASTEAGKLKGGLYRFPKVSHTGTENLMMAATLAEGETVLENAAQ
tara:strand:+ start:455 stop:1039 length:585 start_codon:yes stop_codon:yes gene_type:complete